MRIIDCEQNTPEWYQARLGIPTASCFDKIVTSKGEPSKQREKYLFKLAVERIAGVSEETYQNGNMQRGHEVEAEARNYYQFVTGEAVSQVGFCIDNGYGCSPDGMVGEKGLIQIKCPISSTHVGYILSKALPTDYFQQVQGELLVTGREWSDFLSYYPRIKPLITRINRDEIFLKKLRTELDKFNKELDEIINKIR